MNQTLAGVRTGDVYPAGGMVEEDAQALWLDTYLMQDQGIREACNALAASQTLQSNNVTLQLRHALDAWAQDELGQPGFLGLAEDRREVVKAHLGDKILEQKRQKRVEDNGVFASRSLRGFLARRRERKRAEKDLVRARNVYAQAGFRAEYDTTFDHSETTRVAAGQWVSATSRVLNVLSGKKQMQYLRAERNRLQLEEQRLRQPVVVPESSTLSYERSKRAIWRPLGRLAAMGAAVLGVLSISASSASEHQPTASPAPVSSPMPEFRFPVYTEQVQKPAVQPLTAFEPGPTQVSLTIEPDSYIWRELGKDRRFACDYAKIAAINTIQITFPELDVDKVYAGQIIEFELDTKGMC